MTDHYAVIGHPIAHSKSPLIHRLFAEQTGQDISYEAIEAPLDGFGETIARLRAEGYKGCNVTVPFKFEAFSLPAKLKDKSYAARIAQSANTLVFDNNLIKIRNTDGVGLRRDITNNLGVRVQGRRVLIMGSGGAAWGGFAPLFQKAASVEIVNRSLERAQQQAERFRKLEYVEPSYSKKTQYVKGLSELPRVYGYSDLVGKEFDLIINATSSGLSDELPPLPPGIFAPGALAYDMMYGRETPFMRFAREQGAAQVADGLGMLVEQAAEAFFIWRGVRPDTAPVLAALRG